LPSRPFGPSPTQTACAPAPSSPSLCPAGPPARAPTRSLTSGPHTPEAPHIRLPQSRPVDPTHQWVAANLNSPSTPRNHLPRPHARRERRPTLRTPHETAATSIHFEPLCTPAPYPRLTSLAHAPEPPRPPRRHCPRSATTV
jgi:hypothetical protein